MLFHEIYGNYFNAVAQILGEAVRGELTEKKIYEIIDSKAFAESSLNIPQALNSGEWPLLEETLETPLLNEPQMPLTTLQKRWMKALLADPRIRLFDVPAEGLEDVEPLYRPGAIVYFDQYADGDPFEDEAYITNFRTALQALRENQKLQVDFTGGKGGNHNWQCTPLRMEYSLKDDKFRLIVCRGGEERVINVARINRCSLMEEKASRPQSIARPKRRVLLELRNERNALERAMLHFSHLEKETTKLACAEDADVDGAADRYRITLWYRSEDETELLIRVLSFGPMIKVLEPDSFIQLIRQRLALQKRVKRDGSS